MEQFTVVLDQLIGFAIMLVIGYICVRCKVYGEKTLDGICHLILKVGIPLMVFSNATAGATRADLFESGIILVFQAVMYVLLISSTWLIAKVMRLPADRGHMFQAAFIFGNVGFIGLPLLIALFPERGALFYSLMALLDQFLMWTYGVWLTRSEQTRRERPAASLAQQLRGLLSPGLVSVIVSLLVILIVRHKIPKVPAPVVAVFLSTLLVWLFSLPTDTIGSRFGTLPTGFPDFTLPYGITFERIRELFPDALTIALLAGIESLLACVVADSMTGDRHNSNMELISQGIGNVASVFFGGFAATGAIARTATNVRAGAHSSISAIVHSLFLVVVVMWLLPLTEYIPLAALAAVLVMVAYDMSDLRTVRHIFQGPKSDWSVMILTFALTVIFDLTVAVYTGVMLASLLFMRRMSELTGIHTCVSGEEEEAAAHDIPLPDEETVPDGVEIFAINGPLFFGVADRFQSTLDAMETPPKVFIMYLHNTPAIDMTGIHALEAFLERRQEGCRVLFAAVQEPARRTLQRVGILRAVGEENIYPSLDEALLRAEEILEEEKRK